MPLRLQETLVFDVALGRGSRTHMVAAMGGESVCHYYRWMVLGRNSRGERNNGATQVTT